jgi:hypothetical protein
MPNDRNIESPELEEARIQFVTDFAVFNDHISDCLSQHDDDHFRAMMRLFEDIDSLYYRLEKLRASDRGYTASRVVIDLVEKERMLGSMIFDAAMKYYTAGIKK